MHPNSPAEQWFGDAFEQLHPLIQQLHRQGGTLAGDIQIELGRGVAGFIGRRLAKKMGLPTATCAQMQVHISHTEKHMTWVRRFSDPSLTQPSEFVSYFEPIGNYPYGYWLENTGSIKLKLGVRICQGGWYWQQQTIAIGGIKLPSVLAPRTQAYKKILNNNYEFRVEITLPLLGKVLSYFGELANGE